MVACVEDRQILTKSAFSSLQFDSIEFDTSSKSCHSFQVNFVVFNLTCLPITFQHFCLTNFLFLI